MSANHNGSLDRALESIKCAAECGGADAIKMQTYTADTMTAFRSPPNEEWEEIRTFEVRSATDYAHLSITNSFIPNLYIDIKEKWETKLNALKAYSIEMRDFPHSRSFEGIENLAKYRGNQVDLEYAEAFEVIRKIEIN